MANIWKVCVGTTLTSYNITESQVGSCDTRNTFAGPWNGYTDWQIESDSPVGADLTVYLRYVYYERTYLVINNVVKSTMTNEVGPYYVFDNQTIDLGTDNEQFNLLCDYVISTDIDGYGDGDQTYRELTDVEIMVQAEEPICEDQPSECALEITGYTATAPSVRGESDGEITASVSGMTGSTITWSIGGVEDTGQTDYEATFTGLTADDYWVKAEEGPCLSQVQITVPAGDFRTGDFTVTSPTTTGAIVAVENPVMINIGTAINSIQPLYSINEFDISGTISDVTIEFNLTFPYVYDATFYSKGFPDRGNYFLESVLTDDIGTVAGSNTDAEIATSLAEAFENDSIISRLYYIFVDDTTVTLTSKETNGSYDLSTANVTITGSNLTLTNPQSGIAEFDGQLSANYSVYTELFVDDEIQYGETPDEIDFRRVAEVELPFQKDNNHQFDLSPTLKNFVSSPKLNFSFTGSTFMSDMISSYYVKYGEKYPLIPNSNTKKKRNKGQGGFNWCINSALNFEDPNRMNPYFPPTGTTGVVQFLNTAENTKYSHRNAKEFLNIVLPLFYDNPIAVFGDINMYDGSVHSDVKLYDVTTSGSTNTLGGVLVCAVDYSCTCISDYETGGAKIRSVDITVKQSEDLGVTFIPYSETKTFKFELDEQPDNFNIAFLNKFGTYETYSFIGEMIEAEDIFRDSYQKPYDINPDGSASGGFAYNSTLSTDYTKVFVLNTGIIDEDTYYFLQGLLNSNRLYHYDGEQQSYLTILTQDSTKSTNVNEYSISLVVKETINENNVSQ